MEHKIPKKASPAAADAGVKRRGMLFGLGAAGALAAVATAAVVRPQEVATAAAPQPAAQPPEKGGGYHLSAHVQRYYETTKV